MARDERRDDGPGDGQVRPAPAPAPDPAAHPTRRFTDASPRPAADLLSPRRRHSRAKKKREAREAHERRVARETLEARIRVVLAASPEDRTPEQTALLDAHPSVVAPMRATLERALLRKSQTEARLEEREDPSEVIAERVARLADMIRHLGSFVLHTGAGFSTAARIPDFRGASGVWTMRAKGMSVAMPKFEDCAPTRAHMCAVALHRAGYLTRVVTQNVDGLHTRAGLPPEAVSELHGSVYREACVNPECDAGTYERAFDVTATKPHHGRHRHKTGRACDACGWDLRDVVVQFGERLDHDVLAAAVADSAAAPLSLVLGSSMKVPPASTLPRKSAAMVVCNLQWTNQDKRATMKIRARCDEVMSEICRRLAVPVPAYEPANDPVGAAVLARGGTFEDAKRHEGDAFEYGIRNAAAVYGGGGGKVAAKRETSAGTVRGSAGSVVEHRTEPTPDAGPDGARGLTFAPLSKKARREKKPCVPRPTAE